MDRPAKTKHKTMEVGVDINLPLIKFKENNIHFFYSPALDLTGYGKTEKEARASFDETISQFFKYTISKGTLTSELKKLGWKVNKKKIGQSPSLIDMLNRNNYLVEIFEQKRYEKLNETISLPELG